MGLVCSTHVGPFVDSPQLHYTTIRVPHCAPQDAHSGLLWSQEGGQVIARPWGAALAALLCGVARHFDSPAQLPEAAQNAIKAGEHMFVYLKEVGELC